MHVMENYCPVTVSGVSLFPLCLRLDVDVLHGGTVSTAAEVR